MNTKKSLILSLTNNRQLKRWNTGIGKKRAEISLFLRGSVPCAGAIKESPTSAQTAEQRWTVTGMKIDGMVHCFFEQSGTFKNEFKKIGIHAEDYDIQNDFGETDHVIDLFSEIDTAYEGGASVFDNITEDDLLFAFFPCVRFEEQILLYFKGVAFNQAKHTDKQKLIMDITLMNELRDLYVLVARLFIVCIDRGIKLIMENPYSKQHCLTKYLCIEPKIIDKDRTKNGDYYVKPTQYWFLNCEPEQNMIFEPLRFVKTMSNWSKDKNKHFVGGMVDGVKTSKVARSMIHPQYASRFIRQYILDNSEGSVK